VLEELLTSREVDAVVAVVVATAVTDGEAALLRLAETAGRHPHVPVLVVPLGGLDGEGLHAVTTYSSVASAVRALSHVVGYVRWRAVPATFPPLSDPSAASAARAWCRSTLGARRDCWLDVAQARGLLGWYGVDLLGEVVTGEGQAVAAATRAGYPVAVKAAAAGALHKTEHRLLRIGLGSAEDVSRAVEELGPGAPLLVQPMRKGVELALGMVRDPALGPLVMVAAGGVATDLWADRTFLVPPVSSADAARALRGLRVWPLLDGYRGQPSVDVDAVAELLVAVGRLAVDVPELAELDLNPAIVSGSGVSVVDVRARLATTDEAGADPPPQLRRAP
jgi:acyl-CoA synthetase (NDP forming)